MTTTSLYPVLSTICAAAVIAAPHPATAQTCAYTKPVRSGVVAGEHAAPDPCFSSAYGRFVQAADRGDAAAASAALFMARHGKTLFGSDWAATKGQEARWNALAINAARFYLPMVASMAND